MDGMPIHNFQLFKQGRDDSIGMIISPIHTSFLHYSWLMQCIEKSLCNHILK